MKKNLRTLAVVCLVALMMLTLVACGSNNSKYAGTYDLVTMEMGGVTVTAEDMKAAMPDANIQLVLKEDGSFSLTTLGDPSVGPITENGTWKEKGEGVALTVNGATNMGTVDGDTITLTEDDISIVFKKAA